MEFRDLKRQYQHCKKEINLAIEEVIAKSNFISGQQVTELEEKLADYVGRKYCISCANGTDALQLALMSMEIGEGDAVFVPDFTFFSTAEVVALVGATPVFVDVLEDSFNMNPLSLETAIEKVLQETELSAKLIIPVDLFGQPADFDRILSIAEKYGLKVLEDGAQGFGGNIHGKMACSFGDISTTSFFPAKPLGCYGDGGAIFTDDDELAMLIRSFRVHGKGTDKYDNVRIGLNSRLDTIQAAVLNAKLETFIKEELESVNYVAEKYTRGLKNYVKVPIIKEGFYSSWAQYSILLANSEERDGLMAYLKEQGIPTMIYYRKAMHQQAAFSNCKGNIVSCNVTENICGRVLALPMHPYMEDEEIERVITMISCYLK